MWLRCCECFNVAVCFLDRLLRCFGCIISHESLWNGCQGIAVQLIRCSRLI